MNPANLHELPDDVDALKAMILAAQAKVASAEHKRRRLEAEIAAHEAEIAQMKADKAADVDRIDRLESTSHAAAGSIWNAIGKAADRSSR